MDDAERVVAAFLDKFGVYTGSAESPVGEYTSLNVTLDDASYLFDSAPTIQVDAANLVGHYLAQRRGDEVTATRYDTVASLTDAQARIQRAHSEWQATNHPH